MTSDDFTLAAARPADIQPNVLFTEAVMKRITRPKKHSKFAVFFRRNPAFALFAVIMTVALISGTTYAAINYLWPQGRISVKTAPDASGYKAFSVNTNSCSQENGLAAKYQLKSNANLTDAQIGEAMSAGCEYSNMWDWANKTWPTDTSMVNNATANYVSKNVQLTDIGEARKVVSINGANITTTGLDGSDTSTQTVAKSTLFIAHGQMAQVNDVRPGDVISLVTRETFDHKNSPDCSPAYCTGDDSNKATTLVAVARLSYSVVDYQRLNSDFVSLGPCDHNSVDSCPSAEETTVFFRQGLDVYMTTPQWQETSGKLQSYDDSQMVLKTIGGRIVKIHLDHDAIGSFNSDGSRNNGFQIALGDTLDVYYLNYQSKPVLDDIPSIDFMEADLVTESNAAHIKY